MFIHLLVIVASNQLTFPRVPCPLPTSLVLYLDPIMSSLLYRREMNSLTGSSGSDMFAKYMRKLQEADQSADHGAWLTASSTSSPYRPKVTAAGQKNASYQRVSQTQGITSIG